MKTTSAIIAALILLVALPAAAWEPFTEVTSVCPSCPEPPADQVTLTNGTVIRGAVVGENPSFWVVVRYTEARAIPKAEVQGITWANGTKPASVTSADQILLKSGVVLSGSILEDKTKPAAFSLKSSHHDQTYVVFKSQIAEVYRGGVKVNFTP